MYSHLAHIWRPQRKMLNSTFNVRILNSFIPIFNEKTAIMIENLKANIGGEAFDISKYMFACTLDMVCGKYLPIRRAFVLNSF